MIKDNQKTLFWRDTLILGCHAFFVRNLSSENLSSENLSSENLFEKRFSDTFTKTLLKGKEETNFRKVFEVPKTICIQIVLTFFKKSPFPTSEHIFA